jgi:riboflavin biosynthesis pyrimidine reductase
VAESVWTSLQFPEPPEDRPYVFINMVTTIDGKIITGGRDEAVQDLGSATDHATMHAIEAAADGIIIGSTTIKATPRMNLPSQLKRYCVTGRGGLDPRHDFFATTSLGAWLVMPASSPDPGPEFQTIRAGDEELDAREALRVIRQEHGVRRLLSEGGAELNATLLQEDLVDELFWTIAPKIKLGRDLPNYAGGHPLPRADVMRFTILDSKIAGDEVFMRYRRHR